MQLGSEGTSESWLTKLNPHECAMGMRFPSASCCLCYGHIDSEQPESTKQLGEEGEQKKQEAKQVINHHRLFCPHRLATASSLATIQMLH